MRKFFVTILLSASVLGMSAQQWFQTLNQPETAQKPWTFWYWMFGAVSDEGIRLDLQAMKDAGIAGFYLMPIKSVSDGPQYEGTSNSLSEEWWKRIDTACRTASDLGLEMGIHYSDGFALGGGPWITPEESMQKVVWTDTIVKGGHVKLSLKQPKATAGYYEDIAVYAYPATHADKRTPRSSVQFPFSSKEPCDIDFTYDSPFTLRSVQVITGGNNYQAHRWTVLASDNGVDFHEITRIEPARQGWQNTDAYATYAIPATTARWFRFHWTPEGSDPGAEDMDAAKWKPNLKVANLILGSEPVVDGYEGKSGVVYRVSKYSDSNASDYIPADQIMNVTSACINGNIAIFLPEGNWHILRMGHTSTGHTNATGGGGRGLECDKFSREAIRSQYNNWFGEISRFCKSRGNALTRLHVDSWECGSQNWSKTFPREFQKRRGYSLVPILPIYAGVPIGSPEESDRILRDIRQTISELICEVFFNEVSTLAHNDGYKLSTECVAPTMVSDGLRHYQYSDYPMGEFWLNSPTHDKPNDMLDAISGAHIYGKNIIQAEGFTEVRGTWDEHPGMLKQLLDRQFTMGINSITYHVNTHNPWTDRRPGMTLDGIGTFFQRDNTWWPEMDTFSGYITRCQSLLQYGTPVVDIAAFTGTETPRRSILPERLVTSLPGLFGPENTAREEARLRNEGQPMEVSPVGVNHTKNMTKADQWTNPLHGYKYDTFNPDVLEGARIENGSLVTRGGMTYSCILIPQARKMNPDALNTCTGAIDSLLGLGARVITEPWTESTLSSIGIAPDAALPEGIDYTHRHGSEADIYFLANLCEQSRTFQPHFRATRQYAYVMDPVDGILYNAPKEITLGKSQSLFWIYSDTKVSGARNLPRKSQSLKGVIMPYSWNITFEDNGTKVSSTELFDWSSRNETTVKYYSGHATYETTFFLKKQPKDSRVVMSLGDVRDIATVTINGKLCGTAWTAPYEIDVTDALTQGENRLTVSVVNTWANALLGNDLGTPPFAGIWTNGKYRREEKTTIPSGLIGPISFKTLK